jgi:4-hydroxyproline epimerase
MTIHRVTVIDSHTAGEPTRTIVSGGPDLGTGPIAQRRRRFVEEHDAWRRGLVLEPRGSEVLVGALLLAADDPSCDHGVIFFNNVGALGMCGHATLGVVESLAHLGRLPNRPLRLETPVGVVEATRDESGWIAANNVPSYRYRAGVELEVAGMGQICGDIAWGGNWFFIIQAGDFCLVKSEIPRLLAAAQSILAALDAQGIRGHNGARIDHVEFSAPAHHAENHGRNFVLCPGGVFDRSPCGTGTSAKMACLYADGMLEPGQSWRQESILDTLFVGCVQREGDHLIPTIRGQAHVTAQSVLIFNEDDPLCWGFSVTPA